MLLVDASVYIFRAYHALPDSLRGMDNRPLNVVYGFADFMCGLIENEAPEHIAVAFDESLESSFRNALYPAYKANRETAPADLKTQIKDCQALVQTLGLCALVSERHEADDIIGTLAARTHAHDQTPITIVSSDKDLAQLLGPQDTLWDYARDIRYTPADIEAKFGVRCEQIVDYLALMGDAVDNIPGVAGIGAKTAAALLQARQTLDAIYSDLDQIKALPLRGAAGMARKLEAGRESAFMSRELSQIFTDVDLPHRSRDLRRQPFDRDAISEFCQTRGIGSRLQTRLNGLVQITATQP